MQREFKLTVIGDRVAVSATGDVPAAAFELAQQLAAAAAQPKAPETPKALQSVARVVIDMLPDGRLAIDATAGGRPDCKYMYCTIGDALKRQLPQVLGELHAQCVAQPKDAESQATDDEENARLARILAQVGLRAVDAAGRHAIVPPPGYRFVQTIGADWLEPIDDGLATALLPPLPATPGGAEAASGHPSAARYAAPSRPCPQESADSALRG